MFASRQKSQKGFTLMELLLAVVLIAILVAIGAMAYSQAQVKARNAQRQSDLKKISLALEEFYSDYREYPTNLAFESCLIGSGCTLSSGRTTSNIYITTLPRDPRSNSPYSYTPRDDSSFAGTNYQGYDLSATSHEGGNLTDYTVKSPSR